ncbi:conjugal transfer mating pair stabilization protein TraG [Escherichia coli]|uniref:Conjugal transfer mating pair stabilization protein TraG n=1 Tax=Escherichia coli TaxID=562 RepID=A0A377HGR3_ECOLX|nr:conjugal transfer mating pair stabilization protein TraG [Escherichia coli]
MNADDPYALIFSRPSPLRGLYDKNRNFLTCEQAATRINTDSGDISGANTSPFLQQILNTLHGFTDQVFGQTNGAQSALFTEMLGDSYNYFHRTSLTSTEIIPKECDNERPAQRTGEFFRTERGYGRAGECSHADLNGKNATVTGDQCVDCG